MINITLIITLTFDSIISLVFNLLVTENGVAFDERETKWFVAILPRGMLEQGLGVELGVIFNGAWSACLCTC